MKHLEIVYGEPYLERFALRAFAGVLSLDDEVAMALKTFGPSIKIAMSKAQARILGLELIKAAGGADQQIHMPPRPVA